MSTCNSRLTPELFRLRHSARGSVSGDEVNDGTGGPDGTERLRVKAGQSSLLAHTGTVSLNPFLRKREKNCQVISTGFQISLMTHKQGKKICLAVLNLTLLLKLFANVNSSLKPLHRTSCITRICSLCNSEPIRTNKLQRLKPIQERFSVLS